MGQAEFRGLGYLASNCRMFCEEDVKSTLNPKS